MPDTDRQSLLTSSKSALPEIFSKSLSACTFLFSSVSLMQSCETLFGSRQRLPVLYPAGELAGMGNQQHPEQGPLRS